MIKRLPMMTLKRAVVTWLTLEQGGRRAIPPGPQYATLARIRNRPEEFDGSTWSLVLNKLPNSPDNPWNVEIHWGMEDAPHHWLETDAEFELFEGNRLVARGVIT
jgi:hypothetical protein